MPGIITFLFLDSEQLFCVFFYLESTAFWFDTRMISPTTITNISVLPDEILLEIFKYLLGADVLYSFHGLNQRYKRCISDYFQNLSLSDIDFEKCEFLCKFVLPEIGPMVRSICLNNCRSVLQGKMFARYFSRCFSSVFPHLEKLRLVCFTADEFDEFAKSLNGFSSLKSIEICDLLTEQTNLFGTLVNSNEQRWTSIVLKTSYVHPPIELCKNLQYLTLSMKTVDNLARLLPFLPEIRHLNVTIDEISMAGINLDHIEPLINLQSFTLRCFNHFWLVQEVKTLLRCFPAIRLFSIQISSHDEGFFHSESPIFDKIPSTINEMNLTLRYFYTELEEINFQLIHRSRFPMICVVDDQLEQAVIHTIPYRFPLLNLSPPMVKTMSNELRYQEVDMFYDYHGMSLAEAFPIVNRCPRIKEIAIQSYEENDSPPVSGWFHRQVQ